jgi:hypothetical protein
VSGRAAPQTAPSFRSISRAKAPRLEQIALGPLGVKLSRRAAFKIAADQERNDAWLVMDGHLYSLDLKIRQGDVGRKNRRPHR